MIETACWICGGVADSREHVFKRSEFQRTYKKRLPRGSLLYYSNVGGTPIDVTSSKDEVLTFGKILCKQCNGTLTQPHDTAYSTFCGYLQANKEQVFKDQFVDFEKVYGSSWFEGKMNLFKYVAKHVGCNLALGKQHIPESLAKFILGEQPLSEAIFIFQLHGFIAYLEELAVRTGKQFLHMFYSPTYLLTYTEQRPVKANFGWSSTSFLTMTWVSSEGITSTKKYQAYLNQKVMPLRIRPDTHMQPYQAEIDTLTTIIPKLEHCDRTTEAEGLVDYASRIIKELAD